MINGDMPPVQPQDPYQQPAPPQHDPARYDFIVNPQAPKRPSPFSFGSGGPSMKLLLMGGGVVVVVIILFVIIGSLLGGSKGDTVALAGIAEQQAEIARVAKLGADDAVSQDTQNFATNLSLSIATSEQTMVAYLGKNGVKLGAKQLALKQDSKTDAALTAAQDSGTYDSTFTSLMQTELTNYQASLSKAYKTATGKTEKQVLSDAYANAGLLIKQSSQHS